MDIAWAIYCSGGGDNSFSYNIVPQTQSVTRERNAFHFLNLKQ